MIEPDEFANPAFQDLRAKVEANQRRFRPKETEQLEKLGRFKAMVEEQARACWERNVDQPLNLVSDDDAAVFWRKVTGPAG